MTIETSLPEYQQASTTVHVVTLQEYESLANSSHILCQMTLTDLLRAYYTQLSLQDVDPAEGKHFGVHDN